jgi:S1-C subfamily serine protease
VKERITIGPLNDEEELISKRRANFPAVIAHGLRLYDQDTGVPVFDFKGNCIGIHHARLSRTIGLILPVEVLHEIIPSMIHDSESM